MRGGPGRRLERGRCGAASGPCAQDGQRCLCRCVCVCVPAVCVRFPVSVPRASPRAPRRSSSPVLLGQKASREEEKVRVSSAPRRCVYTHHLLRDTDVFSPFPKRGGASDFTSLSSFPEMCFAIISQSLQDHPEIIPGGNKETTFKKQLHSRDRARLHQSGSRSDFPGISGEAEVNYMAFSVM